MSAVVRSGGGSINELSLSKDTVRRHRNSIRERQAKSVFEKNLETIKASEYNRYLLHWDGKMLQSMEHAGTGAEVVAILLTATHEKHEILLKIENLDGHSTAGELTKIILETLDDCGIDKNLIIGMVFDTTAINTGIRNGVAVCLQKAFGNNLLQLACRHHVLELLCGAAAFLVYGATRSPNEAAFQVLLDRWPSLDIQDFQVYNQKVEKQNLNVKILLPFVKEPFIMTFPEKIMKNC